MLKNPNNLKKNKNSVRPILVKVLVVFALFSLFICMFNFSNNTNVMAESIFYTPASPTGNTSGYVNTSYEYTLYTIDAGTYWMFDWDDGTYSDWIEVEESDTSVSQYHCWDSPDVYEVKAKHRNIYDVESEWSLPLIVNITMDSDGDGVEDNSDKFPNDPAASVDSDNDGYPDYWNYGKNQSDSTSVRPLELDEFPYDPDEWKDSDDDNDGLNNVIEKKLGSNPKNALDVKEIRINGVRHYLVDTTGDNKSNLFYNTESGGNTTMGKAKDGMYLIDFDGNNKWDYTYDPVYGNVARYEEAPPFEFPWLWSIIGIIIAIIIIIFILFKTGFLYIYEEYVVEE